MNDDELNRLQALADAATAGPWGTIPPGGPGGAFWGICNRLGMIVAMRLTDREADAAFIAASRDAIPALIAEVRRLREENDKLRYLLGKSAVDSLRNLERYCPPTATDVANLAKTLANGTWKRSTP